MEQQHKWSVQHRWLSGASSSPQQSPSKREQFESPVSSPSKRNASSVVAQVGAITAIAGAAVAAGYKLYGGHRKAERERVLAKSEEAGKEEESNGTGREASLQLEATTVLEDDTNAEEWAAADVSDGLCEDQDRQSLAVSKGVCVSVDAAVSRESFSSDAHTQEVLADVNRVVQNHRAGKAATCRESSIPPDYSSAVSGEEGLRGVDSQKGLPDSAAYVAALVEGSGNWSRSPAPKKRVVPRMKLVRASRDKGLSPRDVSSEHARTPTKELAMQSQSGTSSSRGSSRRSTGDHGSTDCDADDEGAVPTPGRPEDSASILSLRPTFRDYEAPTPGRVPPPYTGDDLMSSHAIVVSPSASDLSASECESGRRAARLMQHIGLASFYVPVTPSASDLDSDSGLTTTVSRRGVPRRGALSLQQLGLGSASTPSSHSFDLHSPNVSDSETEALLRPLARAWHAAGLPLQAGQAPLALVQQQQQQHELCVSSVSGSKLLVGTSSAAALTAQTGAVASVAPPGGISKRRSSAPSGGVILLLHKLLGQAQVRQSRVGGFWSYSLPADTEVRVGAVTAKQLLPTGAAPAPSFRLHDDIRSALVAEPTLKPLLALLDKVGTEVDEPLALRAVAKLAVNEEVKEEMASASVMSIMVLLIGSGSMPEREAAAGALSNMATNEHLRVAVWLSGAGHALIDLLSDEGASLEAREAAAGALTNLSASTSLHSDIVGAGALKPLLALLSTHSPDAEVAKASACRALANLACGPAAAEALADQKQATFAALSALMCGDDEVLGTPSVSAPTRAAAAMALSNLSFDVSNWEALHLAGGVAAALQLLQQKPQSVGAEGVAAAAILLWNAALHAPSARDILHGDPPNGVVALLKLLCDPESGEDVRRTAAGALGKLSLAKGGAKAVEAAGGVPALAAMLVEAEGGDAEAMARECARGLVALAGSDEARAGRLAGKAGVVQALCGLLVKGKPPTQEVAARALWLLAAGRPDVAREAVERGAVTPLTDMLGLPWDNSRASATRALAALAIDANGQVQIGRSGALGPLVLLTGVEVSSGNVEVRHGALMALTNLAVDGANCRAIARASGISVLVAALSAHEELRIRGAAAQALVNVATSHERRVQAADCGALTALVGLLGVSNPKKCYNPTQQFSSTSTEFVAADRPTGDALTSVEAACNALSNLMMYEPLRRPVAEAGAVAPLVGLLLCPSVTASRAAAVTLQYLATLPDTLGQIQRLQSAVVVNKQQEKASKLKQFTNSLSLGRKSRGKKVKESGTMGGPALGIMRAGATSDTAVGKSKEETTATSPPSPRSRLAGLIANHSASFVRRNLEEVPLGGRKAVAGSTKSISARPPSARGVPLAAGVLC